MKKFTHTIANHWMMAKLFFRFAPVYLIGNLLCCVLVAFQDTLAGPVALQYILNGLTGGKSFRELMLFMAFVSAVIILRHVLSACFSEYLGAAAKIKVRAGMQKMIFEHTHTMDLEYYETPEFYNDFVWAATQSDGKLWDMYRAWTAIVSRVSEAAFAGGFMALTDKTLFLFAVIAIAVRLTVSRLKIKKVDCKIKLDT